MVPPIDRLGQPPSPWYETTPDRTNDNCRRLCAFLRLQADCEFVSVWDIPDTVCHWAVAVLIATRDSERYTVEVWEGTVYIKIRPSAKRQRTITDTHIQERDTEGEPREPFPPLREYVTLDDDEEPNPET